MRGSEWTYINIKSSVPEVAVRAIGYEGSVAMNESSLMNRIGEKSSTEVMDFLVTSSGSVQREERAAANTFLQDDVSLERVAGKILELMHLSGSLSVQRQRSKYKREHISEISYFRVGISKGC